MLWIGSGWWSAAGLLFDIAGFLALAVELLWEARMSVATRNLYFARGHFDRLGTEAITRNEPYAWFNLEPKYRDEVGVVIMPRLKIAARQLKWVKTVPKLDDLKTSTHLGNVIEHLVFRVDDRKGPRFPRMRVPVELSIALVILGFFLQFIGSIPICSDSSVSWPWESCSVVASQVAPASAVSHL